MERPYNRGSRKESVEGVKSEEVILLGYDEYQSSKYLGDLGDLPGMSIDKDELQASTKRIKI